MRRMTAFGLVGLLVAISGANCLWPFGNTDTRVAGLRKFKSAEELRTFFVDQATKGYSNQMSGGDWMMFDAAPGDMAMTPEPDDGAGGTSYSTTNIQEAGVDESDIVKNDGQYIYVLENNTIHIVQAMPPGGLAELATIAVPESADSFYLYGDKLIVLSRKYSWYPYYYYNDFGPVPGIDVDVAASPTRVDEKDEDARKAAKEDESVSDDGDEPEDNDEGANEGEDGQEVENQGDDDADGEDEQNGTDEDEENGGGEDGDEGEPTEEPPDIIGGDWNDGSETIVTVIDVSVPANPSILSQIRMEGDLVSSRMIDNYLYVVMTTTPFIPWDADNQTIGNMTLEQWLPDYQITDGAGQVVGSGPLAGWEDFYRPETPDGYGITTVATVNVDDPSGSIATT
ncbi:MAG: hypothetical protein GXY44_04820, partial [Phycisphaerales bacterium]|nr:hypothetical protein [Phycisphaerales bacterium]